jgi:hypothetical protein
MKIYIDKHLLVFGKKKFLSNDKNKIIYIILSIIIIIKEYQINCPIFYDKFLYFTLALIISTVFILNLMLVCEVNLKLFRIKYSAISDL